MISWATLVAVVSLFVAAPSLPSDQPIPEEEIDALVEQLVSPNPAPDTKVGPTAEYPEGYDRKAQKRVRAAQQKLRELGTAAFPHLIKRLNDDRYSFTAQGLQADKNWTVGQACQHIIDGQLEPFTGSPWAMGWRFGDDPKRRILRPSYCRHNGLHSPERAADWWRAHKDTSLLDLQIESIEWTIAEEAKNPDKYPDEEHKHMREFLKKARSAEKPLMWSVPYRAR